MLQENCPNGVARSTLISYILLHMILLHFKFVFTKFSFIELQICYFFYKNIAFGLTIFYFEAFAGFSGQSVYDDWFMLLFNVVLTSLPVISLGVFEQDVSSEICLQVYDRTSDLI